MELIDDRVARYRPGALNALPNPWTGEQGIQGNRFDLITRKGNSYFYNRGNIPGSSGRDHGGLIEAVGGNTLFHRSISRNHEDIEVPTYIRTYNVPGGDRAAHRDFRFADGSIARWWNQQSHPFNRIDGLVAQAVDPEVPNAVEPDHRSGLTAATMSVMLKSWLYRTGSLNVFTPAAGSAALDGQFVGQDADGPTGIIGTWELPAGYFGVLGDVREAIQGSFGAEFAP